MKAQTVSLKRSTLVSVLLVGAVIAFCSIHTAQADPIKAGEKVIGLISAAVVAH